MDHGSHAVHSRLGDRRRQIRNSLLLFIGVLCVGMLGFMVLGGRGLFTAMYLTAVIITTVGMKEDNVDFSGLEEVWSLGLMLTGIFVALYAAGNVVAFIVEGEIGRMFGRRQLENRIKNLHDHFVVCGFGRMGRALCEALQAKGRAFVVIERDSALTAEADDLGYLYMLGDAMCEQTLRSARIDQASGVACCLSSDADNVFVTLTARGLNNDITIISRSENLESVAKLERAGADRVICTPVLGATRAMQMLTNPAIDDLMEIDVHGPDIEVSKLKVSQLPGLAGQPLMELSLPSRTGLMVVAIVKEDGQRQFNPPADYVPTGNDELLVIGPVGGIEKMLDLFGDDMSWPAEPRARTS